MRSLARWCVTHRRLVVIIWAIVLILSLGIVKSVGTAYSNSFNLPNTESTDAIKLLQAVRAQELGRYRAGRVRHVGRPEGHRPERQGAGRHADHQARGAAPRGADRQPVQRRERERHQRGRDGRLHVGDAQPAVQPAHPERRAALRHYGHVPRQPQLQGGGDRAAGRGVGTAVVRRDGSGRAPGPGRPVARLRLDLCGAAPDHLGAVRAGDGHRDHRDAQPRAEDAGVRPDPRVADRTGGGRRLRPLHRDPAPAGAGGRSAHRGLDHQRRQHLGTGRPLRRHHRLHRPARDVRPGRQLPVRAGGSGSHRSGLHHDRRPDAATGPARASSASR